MIVIEGKSKKSVEIMSMMKRWNKETTLFIDTKDGLNFIEDSMVINTSEDLDSLIKMVKNKTFSGDFKYKRVVFYVNETKEAIFKVWELEQELMFRVPFRECVITIQAEYDSLNVYEI